LYGPLLDHFQVAQTGRKGRNSRCARLRKRLWHLVAMHSNADVPRIPFRRQVYCGQNGEVFITASGESGLNYARVYAPSSEEIRSMLLQLRRRQRWSRAHLAAVLGVPKHTLRRWEDHDAHVVHLEN
jgi:hypothetical protein